jgi:hypothetical protein
MRLDSLEAGIKAINITGLYDDRPSYTTRSARPRTVTGGVCSALGIVGNAVGNLAAWFPEVIVDAGGRFLAARLGQENTGLKECG